MDRLNRVAFKPRKVFWKEKGTKPYSFICPLCTSQRKIPYQPRPTARHYVQIALTAACCMMATWPVFGWKGFVSFIPIWTIFEVLYRGRVRGAMLCPQCGFDPFLYMVDVKRARREVEAHWRKKFADKGIPYPEKQKSPAPLEPQPGGVLLATNKKRPAATPYLEMERKAPPPSAK